jgi:hypothetical protein
MDKIIYEEKLKYGKFLKIVIIFMWIILAVPLLGIIRFGTIIEELMILAVIFSVYSIMPRKYQILNDRIRIVCSIFKIDIKFENIERIEMRPPSSAYASMEGARFATGTGQKCLLLVKNHGINFIIQPTNTEKFLEYLNKTSDIPIIND